MQPPEPLTWEQRDAMRLRCDECGEEVRAECADLHECVRGAD